ncbi:hypothetical protein [Plantactinospora soyae]|uniref:Uncharacterized protein n=1 Tax=Plantactinospora soyae TaxID=1544732 RepID=A0A927M907_9ACTN|nr:hypothetical protein [Plantactinospora soyae]MBE1490222.1 hypothetical protein [Plantactinospora soyae]
MESRCYFLIWKVGAVNCPHRSTDEEDETVEPDDARIALDEIRDRDRQVRVELARQRPGRSATLMMLAGYYLAMAGLDFPFPVPLTFAVGAALFIAGHVVISRRSVGDNVRYRRESWRPGNLLRTAAWLVALAAVFAVTRLLLRPVVAEGMTSVLAAVPSTLVLAAMIRWQYRTVYGAPPAAGAVSAQTGPGPAPARTDTGGTMPPPQTGTR